MQKKKRDKAKALKGQASALETTLKQAETDKANAQKVSDQAEAELKLAQTALAEAKAKLQALLDVLEAENMLKVAEKRRNDYWATKKCTNSRPTSRI